MKRHVLVVTLLLLALLDGCGPREEPRLAAGPSVDQPSLHAAVTEVRTIDVPVRVEVTGQVSSVSIATLSSKVQGTVQEIRVREGSRVIKGQVLLVLDSRDLRANLARAEADLENAQAQMKRMESLFAEDPKSISKQELDNAIRGFKVAEAEREAVQSQLSYTTLTAPFDGVVTEKSVEVGELASAGQPLLKMEAPDRLRLEATVAEGDLSAITEGTTIPVTIDALEGMRLQGIVSQILPAGDPQTHTFLVKIDLPRTPKLKTGMFGRLQLQKASSQTLVIPRTAVTERGQLTGVFAVGADNVARLRWIKAGRILDGGHEVLSGLNPGERVLTDASKGMDGAVVHPLQTTAESRR